MMNKYFFL